MRVLALDTCSPHPAAALLVTASGESCSEDVETLPPSSAEALAGTVAALLARAGLVPADIDQVAVLAGPGSFTGIRAGLAFGRGLARAIGSSLETFSTFEVAAEALGSEGDVDLFLEAGRREVHRARRRSGRLAEDPSPLPRALAEADADGEGVPARDVGAASVHYLATVLARMACAGAMGTPLRYGRASAAEERFGVPGGGLAGTGLS